MMCYGISNAIAAILIGSISKITGRNPIIVFALILHVTLMIVLLNWKPNGIITYPYFVVVGLWGVADAIWLVQINCKFRITPFKIDQRFIIVRIMNTICFSIKRYFISW